MLSMTSRSIELHLWFARKHPSSNIRYGNLIISYVWHLRNQGGKTAQDLCLVSYEEFKRAFCDNRICKLPITKKEKLSDFEDLGKLFNHGMPNTSINKCREKYYLLKQERKKVLKLPSASCRTASPKSRKNCRIVWVGNSIIQIIRQPFPLPKVCTNKEILQVIWF